MQIKTESTKNIKSHVPDQPCIKYTNSRGATWYYYFDDPANELSDVDQEALDHLEYTGDSAFERTYIKIPHGWDDDAFIDHYFTYLNLDENDQDAVDAYIEYTGITDMCPQIIMDEYQGLFSNKVEFTQFYVDEIVGEVEPSFVVVDWEATADNIFDYDFIITSEGYVFRA
ncbi:MAG: hypothetical protein ACPH5P_00170 [Akkermansiaceae bacterium]